MFSQASDENGGTPVESAYAVRLLYHQYHQVTVRVNAFVFMVPVLSFTLISIS